MLRFIPVRTLKPLTKPVGAVRTIQTPSEGGLAKRFWAWTNQPRPSPLKNWKEGIIVCAIFGVAGANSVLCVRPLLGNVFGLQGSMIEGPNSYRVASLLFVSPVYALIILTYGTLLGRHPYFARLSMKILGRFAPSSLIRKVVCAPAQAKMIKPQWSHLWRFITVVIMFILNVVWVSIISSGVDNHLGLAGSSSCSYDNCALIYAV